MKRVFVVIAIVLLSSSVHAEDWQQWMAKTKADLIRRHEIQHVKECAEYRASLDSALKNLKQAWEQYGVSAKTADACQESRKIIQHHISCSTADDDDLWTQLNQFEKLLGEIDDGGK